MTSKMKRRLKQNDTDEWTELAPEYRRELEREVYRMQKRAYERRSN